MTKAPEDVVFFGIRHHGPGSAASLVRALDETNPVAVLIEGPSDATPILPMLVAPDMKPPVARHPDARRGGFSRRIPLRFRHPPHS
ncbi:MAG: DUF5682 family protein [Candidatus Accumulibacter sp.]|jgi:hypothetical protein|nr:DUF5682 family protein [Accumulibacter sp.]